MADPSPLLCAALCLIGAALLLTPALRSRSRLLLGWALLTLLLCLGPATLRLARGGDVREYTFAHYHLGSRYFAELGYEGLYSQAIAARPRPDIETMRDLGTYGFVPATGERGDWSEARWVAFGDDLDALRGRQDARSWRSWFRDKGFNATPAWTATLGRIVGAAPASPTWFALLGWLDLALLLVPFAAAGRVFGWTGASLGAAGVAVFYGSAQNLVGGPLQLDWLAASVLGLCALRRGRHGGGGALLGWAMVSRVFPALLLVAPVLAAWRRPDLRPGVQRLVLGALAVIALGLGLGATTARGPAAWAEFGSKITTHAHNHHLGDRRIGLRPLLAWAPMGERSDAAARADRAQRWPDRRVPAAVTAAALCLLWGLALQRGVRRDHDPLVVLVLLALALPFLLTTLSRYYQLLPALGLLLVPHPRAAQLGGALLGSWALVWLAIAALPDATAYAVANGLWLLVGMSVMAVWGTRPRAPNR